MLRENTVSKPAFWPGLNWRVLAHRRIKPLKDGYSDETWDMHAGERWKDKAPHLGSTWEFDELVIDDWFHIEQMDTRVWWMRVGNQDDNSFVVWVTVDRDGVAEVSVRPE